MVDQEAFDVGCVSGDGADAGGERIDALVREEAPVLQSDDVFGDVLELGDHVRGDEEGAPRAAPLHAVGGQGEQLLVEGIAGGHVQGCLNLVEDGDGGSRGQRDGAREDRGLAGGDLAQLLATLHLESETLCVVVEKLLVPGWAQGGVRD